MSGPTPVGADLHLADIDPASTPGITKGRSEAARKRALARRGARGPAGAALRRGARQGGKRSRAAGAAGHGHLGQGRHRARTSSARSTRTGVRCTAFKAPTEEERRTTSSGGSASSCRRRAMVGVFDRSHYEDVLIARVHELVPAEVIEQRYGADQRLRARARRDRHHGRQGDAAHLRATSRRPAARPARPTRQALEVQPRPTSTSARCWAQYQEAYQTAITSARPTTAPWYVVPADHKWYARLRGAARLLLDTLREHRPAVAERRLRRRGAEGAPGGHLISSCQDRASGSGADSRMRFSAARSARTASASVSNAASSTPASRRSVNTTSAPSP